MTDTNKILKASSTDVVEILDKASERARNAKTEDELKDVIKDIRRTLQHDIDMRSLATSKETVE